MLKAHDQFDAISTVMVAAAQQSDYPPPSEHRLDELVDRALENGAAKNTKTLTAITGLATQAIAAHSFGTNPQYTSMFAGPQMIPAATTAKGRAGDKATTQRLSLGYACDLLAMLSPWTIEREIMRDDCVVRIDGCPVETKTVHAIDYLANELGVWIEPAETDRSPVPDIYNPAPERSNDFRIRMSLQGGRSGDTDICFRHDNLMTLQIKRQEHDFARLQLFDEDGAVRVLEVARTTSS